MTGQGDLPGALGPFLPGFPTWLSTFGAAPSKALIPRGVLSQPPVLCLAIGQLPCAQRKTPSDGCSEQGKLPPATTASAQKPADGCGMAPGSRVLVFDAGCPGWLLAQPQLPVLPLPVVICWGKGQVQPP